MILSGPWDPWEFGVLMGVPWDTFLTRRNVYEWNHMLSKFVRETQQIRGASVFVRVSCVLDFLAWLKEKHARCEQSSWRNHNKRVLATAIRAWERNLVPALVHQVLYGSIETYQRSAVEFARGLPVEVHGAALSAVYRMSVIKLHAVEEYLKAQGWNQP